MPQPDIVPGKSSQPSGLVGDCAKAWVGVEAGRPLLSLCQRSVAALIAPTLSMPAVMTMLSRMK
jgi:hypothetical protein